MRRYPAYDPPEYVDWELDPALLDAYVLAVRDDPARAAALEEESDGSLLELYTHLLRTRLVDIGLKRWVRTGVISKAWLGTGEEAVTVGSVAALDRDRDVVCPMIRNAGALPMMGMPVADVFRGYLGSEDGPSGGRDLHVGNLDHGVLQPVSHMGTNVPVMAGVALAFRSSRPPRVALTWVGDGATRTAAFHEGMNFAAVKDLPLVVVLQNNQVALGTPLGRHGRGDVDRWPDAYGVPFWRCDGNNVLDVLACARLAVASCRRGEGPAMLVAETFRMGGHATHDEEEARQTFSPELFEAWGRRDPVALFEAFLTNHRGVEPEALAAVESRVSEEVDAAAADAGLSRDRTPSGPSARYAGFSLETGSVGLTGRPI
jgi:TPP-dependent pyruvate/acetoin dehydrogenase alpha subunit